MTSTCVLCLFVRVRLFVALFHPAYRPVNADRVSVCCCRRLTVMAGQFRVHIYFTLGHLYILQTLYIFVYHCDIVYIFVYTEGLQYSYTLSRELKIYTVSFLQRGVYIFIVHYL